MNATNRGWFTRQVCRAKIFCLFCNRSSGSTYYALIRCHRQIRVYQPITSSNESGYGRNWRREKIIEEQTVQNMKNQSFSSGRSPYTHVSFHSDRYLGLKWEYVRCAEPPHSNCEMILTMRTEKRVNLEVGNSRLDRGIFPSNEQEDLRFVNIWNDVIKCSLRSPSGC